MGRKIQKLRERERYYSFLVLSSLHDSNGEISTKASKESLFEFSLSLDLSHLFVYFLNKFFKIFHICKNSKMTDRVYPSSKLIAINSIATTNANNTTTPATGPPPLSSPNHSNLTDIHHSITTTDTNSADMSCAATTSSHSLW